MRDEDDGLEVLGRLFVLAIAALAVLGFVVVKFW
jgi:hypothetical protein